MFLFAIPYPDINPEVFAIDLFGFHLAIRWYSLAYIAGILLAWRVMLWTVRRKNYPFPAVTTDAIDDFITYAILGIVIGGRLFGTLVYNWDYYSQNPVEIIMPPYAGMSFHGGFLGVILAAIFVAWKQNVPLKPFADIIALTAPFGLFFGRLANFVNAELWGRQTDVPWAVIFPAESFGRHPSQLYEAGLEGILLGIVLWAVYASGGLRRPGLITGIFFLGYALARIIVEFYREPDAQFASMDNPVGYAIQFGNYGITMGQLLSLPMIAIGLYFVLSAKPIKPNKSNKKSGNKTKKRVEPSI